MSVEIAADSITLDCNEVVERRQCERLAQRPQGSRNFFRSHFPNNMPWHAQSLACEVFDVIRQQPVERIGLMAS